MRLIFAAAALAAACATAPAQAVTVDIAPMEQAFLVSSSGSSTSCPPTAMPPAGQGCIITPGVSRQFSIWDGFTAEAGNLDGTFTYTSPTVGYLGDQFGYSGTLVFSNGLLLSSVMDIHEFGESRYFPQFPSTYTSFDQTGHFVGVAVRLPNGAIILPLPEAATWTMLVAGFGAVGFALRRRGTMALQAA